MNTDVSIIIPVYNGEKTIGKCLDSALGQSLSGIEVIVVNDGSCDRTAEIVQSYCDNRLRLITIENRGQGLARNEGIKAAKGRYVGFLDADDTVSPDMYKNMVELADSIGADMVQCAINDIKDGKEKARAAVNEPCVHIKSPKEYVDKYFYTLNHTNEVCNKIFRKEFLDKHDLWFSDTREFYSEDLKFNIDVLSYLKTVAFTDKAYYNYYISESGHCKKNPRERAVKIEHLYNVCIGNIKDDYIKNCIRSMALITLFSYIAPYTNETWAKKIVINCKKRGYMTASVKYKRTLKHTLLMISLLTAPYALKQKIIRKYYVF